MSIPNPNDKTLELDLYATNEILNQIALVALVVDYEELGWTIRLAMRLGYGDIETKSGIEEIIFTVKKWNGTSRKNSMTLERTLYTFLYAGDGYYGHNKVEIRDAMFDEAQSFMDISKKIVQV
jgi:hypothetical protein